MDIDRDQILKGCKLIFDAAINADSQALGEILGDHLGSGISVRTSGLFKTAGVPHTWDEAIKILQKKLRFVIGDKADAYRPIANIEDLLCFSSIDYVDKYIDMKSCEFVKNGG